MFYINVSYRYIKATPATHCVRCQGLFLEVIERKLNLYEK